MHSVQQRSLNRRGYQSCSLSSHGERVNIRFTLERNFRSDATRDNVYKSTRRYERQPPSLPIFQRRRCGSTSPRRIPRSLFPKLRDQHAVHATGIPVYPLLFPLLPFPRVSLSCSYHSSRSFARVSRSGEAEAFGFARVRPMRVCVRPRASTPTCVRVRLRV